MTIEEKRAQAVSKLGELKEIIFARPTAQDLHSVRPMLARVQRQEQRRHKVAIISQKKKLKKDISNIDIYLKSVADYETYLAGNSGEEPSVLSLPSVVFGKRPVLKKTKLSKYKRRSKY